VSLPCALSSARLHRRGRKKTRRNERKGESSGSYSYRGRWGESRSIWLVQLLLVSLRVHEPHSLHCLTSLHCIGSHSHSPILRIRSRRSLTLTLENPTKHKVATEPHTPLFSQFGGYEGPQTITKRPYVNVMSKIPLSKGN